MHIHTNSQINGHMIEGLIKITNTSSEPLNNIKLILENLNMNVLEYIVVRERGSLTFTPPLQSIELGNLYPDESAELHYKVDSANINPDTFSMPLEDLKICYSHEDKESTISDLKAFINQRAYP